MASTTTSAGFVVVPDCTPSLGSCSTSSVEVQGASRNGDGISRAAAKPSTDGDRRPAVSAEGVGVSEDVTMNDARASDHSQPAPAAPAGSPGEPGLPSAAVPRDVSSPGGDIAQVGEDAEMQDVTHNEERSITLKSFPKNWVFEWEVIH